MEQQHCMFSTDCKFIEVEGREVLSGNIENVPIKEKAKFPQYFFPEFKWSRKGFLRTRWSINNCIFDLVNIHLFHDASNIVAMESSPSVYSGNRQRALLHTLQRFENDKYSKVPLFIFGDFNFRLDSNLLIQELTGKLVACQTKGKKDQVNKIEYTEEGNGKIVLTIGSKSFDYYDKHTDLFANMNKWLHQYDIEFSSFRDRLFEFEISFPPSYPFCEDVTDGISYMKTRVPSWCDRILLTHSARDILSQDPSHQVAYDLMGKEVCMGDHKPAYLFLHMKPGKGNNEEQEQKSPDSQAYRPMLALERRRTLSINGELLDDIDFSSSAVDLSSVNIHDFAVFEKEHDLIPEFKNSIKNRKSLETGEVDNEGDKDKLAPSKPTVSRNRSFQEVARQVRTMEKVLLKWPKRPRSRHHSSSSEDCPSEESEGINANSIQSDNVITANVEQAEITNIDKSSVEITLNDGSEPDKTEILHGEANNNKDAAVLQLNNNQGDGVRDVVTETDIKVELKGESKEGLGLVRADSRQQQGGCGDGGDTAKGVVLLAGHDGHVHADSASVPASSSNPQPSSQSGGIELQSGKAGTAKPTSPTPAARTGCCSCVVL